MMRSRHGHHWDYIETWSEPSGTFDNFNSDSNQRNFDWLTGHLDIVEGLL